MRHIVDGDGLLTKNGLSGCERWPGGWTVHITRERLGTPETGDTRDNGRTRVVTICHTVSRRARHTVHPNLKVLFRWLADNLGMGLRQHGEY